MKKLTLTNAEFLHLKELYQTELEKAHQRIEHLSAILKKLDAGIETVDTIEAKSTKVTKNNDLHLDAEIKNRPKRGRKPNVNVEDPLAKPKLPRGRRPKEVALEEKPILKRGRKPKDTIQQEKPKLKRGRKPKSQNLLPEAVGIQKPKRVKRAIKKGVGKKKVKWNDFIIDFLAKRNMPQLSSDITKEAVTHFKIKESNVPRVRLVISGVLSKLVSTDKKLKTQKQVGSREKLYGLNDWFNEEGNLLPNYAKQD
ncbi:MAG: hypothetical protein CVT98_03495 [Bacteroidetes bacterium HGW-Bacteroidetes-15]|nr:MAG: hypothetical protein CVT98_03495 [Bacteroidetes bacterium HGW-Bacteroidetes-15]